MAETLETQLLVLGAGPGGYAAAFLAADKGMTRHPDRCGPRSRAAPACTSAAFRPRHCCTPPSSSPTPATPPTSALRSARRRSTSTACAAPFRQVVDTLSGNLVQLAKAARSTTSVGRGRFVDGTDDRGRGRPAIRFEHCIIATGSSPVRPGTFDLPTARASWIRPAPSSSTTCRPGCWSSAAATSAWRWATSTPPWAARSPSSN